MDLVDHYAGIRETRRIPFAWGAIPRSQSRVAPSGSAGAGHRARGAPGQADPVPDLVVSAAPVA